MKIFISKIRLFCLILVFSILLNPTLGANNTNITDNGNEYLLIAGDETPIIDKLNIEANSVIKFRILNNNSKKFTDNGTVKIGDISVKITWFDLVEKAKDIFIGGLMKLFGGDDTVGNNSEYYAEHTFVDRTDSYSLDAIGEYNTIPTKNKIIINVKTKYITKNVSNAKTYQLASLKNLSSRILKYHSVNHGQIAEELIKNINEFLSVSNELQNKIGNLTNNPKETINSLPVEKVLETQKRLEDSTIKFNNAAEADKLIGKELKGQLDSIEKDSNQVVVELSSSLNSKNENLLKEELDSAKTLEEKRKSEFSTAKSDFREDIFIPAVVIVILGLIIGYFNVNRWKKESEYFGLYTSRANITSPITIAIILTVVISILIGIIVYIEGDLNMFKFLI